MVIYAYIFIVAGIFLIISSLSKPQEFRKVEIEGKLPGGAPHADSGSKFRGLFVPLSGVGRTILEKLKLENKIRNDLLTGRVRLSPVEFVSVKIILIGASVFAAFLLMGEFNPMATPVAILVGYMLPDIWLQKKVNTRKQAIGRLLPETVDLMGLCIEAGLDFTMAIKWIIQKSTRPNPFLEELAFILEEIRWGKPRSQALKDMAKRLNIPEVSSFTLTLVIAERMGTPVAEAFSILSEDMRLARFNRGERIAMQAPIKILIPLIFCILPVIGIIIGGPILLQFMEGGIMNAV